MATHQINGIHQIICPRANVHLAWYIIKIFMWCTEKTLHATYHHGIRWWFNIVSIRPIFDTIFHLGKWVIYYNGFSRTSGLAVHVIHVSRVAKTYNTHWNNYIPNIDNTQSKSYHWLRNKQINNTYRATFMLTNHWRKTCGLVYMMSVKSLDRTISLIQIPMMQYKSQTEETNLTKWYKILP